MTTTTTSPKKISEMNQQEVNFTKVRATKSIQELMTEVEQHKRTQVECLAREGVLAKERYEEANSDTPTIENQASENK